MRLTKLFLPTLRETPQEAEIASHQLMLRAGLVRKQAAGIYSFLPLGYRVIRKIEQIVRQEMDNIGAQELLMPALLPSDSYQASGRWDTFGQDMFRLKDRNGRDFCIGPTHEEIFAETVRGSVRSYRALPLALYQMQTKYRDERRPRFGVMRSREFIMKDAYSFDLDEAGLDESFQRMHSAYKRIFDRLKLECLAVDADSGAMGGSGSKEFTVMSDIGESTIVSCPACGYAANEEKAECPAVPAADNMNVPPPEPVSTPNARTIAEVTGFLGCKDSDLAKTLIFRINDGYVAAMVRGDRELNEAKLAACLGSEILEMADEGHVTEITGAEVGFAGPVGLKIKIIADRELLGNRSLTVGANKTGYHLKNVVSGRDFEAEYADIRNIAEGDPCPKCGGKIVFSRGIEVGHIFKLGTKYSCALGCNYVDEAGCEHPMVMGSYGIGISRSMAAIIEQNHDENGIIWPVSVAPYQVVIVPVNVQDEKLVEVAENLYKSLMDNGAEVLIDDRNERAGVKFKDADLIGIPIRINVGRKAAEGLVEFKLRRSGDVRLVTVDEAVKAAMEEIHK